MFGFAPRRKSAVATLRKPPRAAACRAVSPYSLTTSVKIVVPFPNSVDALSMRNAAAASHPLAEKS